MLGKPAFATNFLRHVEESNASLASSSLRRRSRSAKEEKFSETSDMYLTLSLNINNKYMNPLDMTN